MFVWQNCGKESGKREVRCGGQKILMGAKRYAHVVVCNTEASDYYLCCDPPKWILY